MSLYNGILNHDDIHGSGMTGPRGLPGIGFNLDSNNDYDMQNKKLVSVKNGVNGSDAVTKSQLDTKTSLLDGARTHGYIYVIHQPRGPYWEKLCPTSWIPPEAVGRGRYPRQRAQFFPIRTDLVLVNNIFIFF